MDFDHAVKTINKLLIEKRSDTFSSSWILKHAPRVYGFIQKNMRAEIGGINWDRVTRALDRTFQRKWNTYSGSQQDPIGKNQRSLLMVGLNLVLKI
jgi:hypothetical protein